MRYKSTRIPLSGFLVIAALAVLVCGCPEKTERPQSPQPEDALLSQEIMRRVSERTLAGVPKTELMRDIRKRGVIRVELPAEEKPFQYASGARIEGFNADLVREIALVLGVKPNIEIGSGDGRGVDELDFFIYREGVGSGRRLGGKRFFYLGEKEGWLAVYVAGGDKGLSAAVENILDYLQETGIFARLYRKHFYAREQRLP